MSTPIPSPRHPSPAEQLDDEAASYAKRADELEAEEGSGSYVALLRGMSADRRSMAAGLRRVTAEAPLAGAA